jgi:hypothetical protein
MTTSPVSQLQLGLGKGACGERHVDRWGVVHACTLIIGHTAKGHVSPQGRTWVTR